MIFRSGSLTISMLRDTNATRRPNVTIAVVVATAVFAGCAEERDAAPAAQASGPETAEMASVALPEVIVAELGGFIPEGIEYDTVNGRILTGSLTEGSIFHIHADGRVTTVVSDPDLISSIGIEVEEQRNRILVANSDRAVFEGVGRGQAKLGVYDLSTGDRIAMVDLAATIEDPPADAAHFANDVASGVDGTAYVTDTRMNVIYRVDTDYRASVFHQFGAVEGLGLNGIVVHPEGYLLVAGGATLWKVPLDDPGGASQVTLPEPVPGQDGMVWMADGRLAIVSNSGNRVVALTSEDDWATAELAGVAPYETQATTAAVVGDNIYVIHPHFAAADPPSVERVTFR